MKKNIIVEGFEGYDVRMMSTRIFVKYNAYLSPWYSNHLWEVPASCRYVLYEKGNQILNEIINSTNLSRVFPETGNMDGVETVYIHPDCKLSKTLVYQKYKRCLDPWKADVVVIPNPSYKRCDVNENIMLSVSDSSVFLCSLSSEYLDSVIPGKTVGECAGVKPWRYDSDSSVSTEMKAQFKEACNSVIDGVYNTIQYVSGMDWIKNYIDGVLPKDKIVWESTIQKYLGSEENKITVESLQGILEMLKSSDNATQATGLKALSVMDWANYPASVRYVLQDAITNTSSLIYNNAWKATSVKFMKNGLKNAYSRHCPFQLYNQRSITRKDWDVLKPLVKKTGNWDASFLGSCGFLIISDSGTIEINEKP